MRVLVTGAGGFIGAALVRRLVDDSHEVIAVAHRQVVSPDGVQVATYALGAKLPRDLLESVDRVIHLAHDMTPGSLHRNVEGTRRWFDQAGEAGVAVQVYVSSYSAAHDSPSEYGRAKYEVEQYVGGRGATILRPGLVLGPGGTFGRLVRAMRRVPLLPVPGGDLRVFLTDLDDMLRVLMTIDVAFSGRTLNLFAAAPMPLRDVLERTRLTLGIRVAIVSIPAAVALPLMRVVGFLHPALRRQRESLAALAASQSYGYPSSYPQLGLAGRSAEETLLRALGPFQKDER